jgi:hypothetical protein
MSGFETNLLLNALRNEMATFAILTATVVFSFSSLVIRGMCNIDGMVAIEVPQCPGRTKE